MKKVVIPVAVCVLILSAASPAFAEKNVNRITTWNKVTDFFATVGKDDSTKKSILKTRKKVRREARQFKQRQKVNKQTAKRMQRQKDKILKGITTRKVPHARGGVDLPKK